MADMQLKYLFVMVFQASSKDTGQLAAALHHRILALKSRADQEPEAPTTAIPEADVPQSNEDDSDEDEVANTASASTPAGGVCVWRERLGSCHRSLLEQHFY